MVEYYANVPASAIKGTRAPFLLMGGDPMFSALKDSGFSWDCSWATRNLVNPGLWPYTLDYRSNQVIEIVKDLHFFPYFNIAVFVKDCPVGICPTESFPGMWVAPMGKRLSD